MKEKASLMFAGLCIGFSLGMAISNTFYINDIDSVFENFELSNVAETNINLLYAKSIRKGDTADMVEHFESLIETNVLGFTDNGNALDSLSENDLCVFNKVKEYWERECNKMCFPELKPIFETSEERITSACIQQPSVAGTAKTVPLIPS